MANSPLSTLSLEYVLVPVATREDQDPTTDSVYMAFMVGSAKPGGSKPGADWKTASWEADGDLFSIRCLVGPSGDATLAAGTYMVWVSITDNPEAPVKRSGPLTVE